MANNTMSNITSNLTNVQLEEAPAILTALLLSTGLWIIIINVLVFSCLITSRSAKKNYVHLQLLSLSVTDALVGAFSIPVTLTFKITGSFPTYGVCASLFYLYVASQVATLNHALVICVHRLITVKRKNKNVSVIKPKFLLVFFGIAFVWTVSLIVIGIPFLIYGRFGERLSSCSLNILFSDEYSSAIGIFTIGLLTPHICLNIVYLHMLLYLKRKWRQILSRIDNGLGGMRMTQAGSGRPIPQTITPMGGKNLSSHESLSGQKRVLLTIGILLVCLNVFMTPLNFLTLFEFLHTGYLSRRVKFIFMNMAILNSALNPVINVFRIKSFKEALRQNAIKLCRLLFR